MHDRVSGLALGFLAAVILVAGCASSDTSGTSTALDVQIEQLPDSGFEVQKQDAVSVAYQMTVHNRSAVPVTLRRVEMRTVGRSPYLLRSEAAEVNEVIEAGKSATVTFSMWSSSRKGSAAKSTVWVQGTISYDGATAGQRESFSASFREP